MRIGLPALMGVSLMTNGVAAPQSDGPAPPGVVIAHSPATSKRYIGSPAIAMLPDGSYVATHDIFGPKSKYGETYVYRSPDRGRSWERLAAIDGQFWSTLFVHGSALYIMGASQRYGHCVIRRSDDGGKTWTAPKDAESGLLHDGGKYHCAPVPIVVHNGRIWRAMEDAMGPGGWGSHFRAFMMSAPIDSDLLKASSWTSSNRLERNPDWLGGRFGGWLEGNAVVTPDGRIVNILRADYRDANEKAAVIRLSDDGRTATFDPDRDFIDLPGGCKKFSIRFDPATKRYWSLANTIPPWHSDYPADRARNTLALTASDDLRSWEVRSVILYHPDPAKHGFQYVDWLFDGDDLVALSRTAYDDGLGGAHNQHDANYLTFHRIDRFRERSMADSPAGYLKRAGQ